MNPNDYKKLEKRVAELEKAQKASSQQLQFPLDVASIGALNNALASNRMDKIKAIRFEGRLSLGEPPTLVIDTGAIYPTTSYHEVDTEAAASTDDLDTIDTANFENGEFVVIRAVSSARSIVLKDGTGNLRLAGDCTLDHDRDTITLLTNGFVWYELARSNNDS